jgi:hypothetical protein
MAPGLLDPAVAADITAITQVAIFYSESASRGDVDSAVSVYTQDGERHSSSGQVTVGRTAIGAALRAAMNDFDLIFNVTQTGVVQVDGPTATARFPVTEWAHKPDGTVVQFLFWWEDSLVRTDEGWRFARRTQIPGARYEYTVTN